MHLALSFDLDFEEVGVRLDRGRNGVNVPALNDCLLVSLDLQKEVLAEQGVLLRRLALMT